MNLAVLAEGDPTAHVGNVRPHGHGATNDPQILNKRPNPVLDDRCAISDLLASHVLAQRRPAKL